MSKKTISPGGHVTGVVELPGDKSISHRYAILAALAEGRSEIFNYATAADCRSTLECLRKLGAEVDATREGVRIIGRGLDGLKGTKTGARCREFRQHDANAFRGAGRTEIHVHNHG